MSAPTDTPPVPTRYITRVAALAVMRPTDSIYSDTVTTVGLDDEGAGEYVVVKQPATDGEQCIRIDTAEWPTLREAIDAMIGHCRDVVEEKA